MARKQKYYVLYQKAFVKESGEIIDSKRCCWSLSPFSLVKGMKEKFEKYNIDPCDFEMVKCVEIEGVFVKYYNTTMCFSDALKKYSEHPDGKVKRIWKLVSYKFNKNKPNEN